ncbi:MAG TPA: cupredoxin domain-containing protein [Acidimicrobiales bacterium]|nr:cupredoxin domain-containing protein [Acidimicrobiales bacterium]
MDHVRTRVGWLVAGLAALTLLLSACGDDDDDGSSSDTTAEPDGDDASGGGATDGRLEVTSFDYSDVTAPAGGTLEVVNESGGDHTVTADDGEFDEELPDGETVEVPVPSEPGEYGYHCEIHPSMAATLTVE